MSKQTEHLAADLEMWADRIEDRRRFITPDEMNCAAIMRLAAQKLTERKPLTDEHIARIYNRYGGEMINCARAIEREHGVRDVVA